MPDRLNILIADNDPPGARRIKELCLSIPGVHVVGLAHSPGMLVAKINNAAPDLILLCPTHVMGGIDSVDAIKKNDPDLDVILVYLPTDHDPDLLVDALELGVYECIEKPDKTGSRQYNELRLRLLTITGLLRSRKRFSKKKNRHYKSRFFMPAGTTEKNRRPLPPIEKIDVIVIASSTGGPEILSRIFSILPRNLRVPILLVQHIPENMSGYFAASLNRKSELDICIANQGDEILPSNVYVAPGGRHMAVSKPDAAGKRFIVLDTGPPMNSVRPSADFLFKSVAGSYAGHVLAIVLTGMGEDGKKGVAALKQNKCYCVTQTAETCVVYGMPKAVDEAGLSDENLDPLSITQKIVMMAGGDRA